MSARLLAASAHNFSIILLLSTDAFNVPTPKPSVSHVTDTTQPRHSKRDFSRTLIGFPLGQRV